MAAMTKPGRRSFLKQTGSGLLKAGRDAIIRLWREARALVLSGDQHLASVVRHGVDDFTDGVVQFSGPGGGTNTQRWFQPWKPFLLECRRWDTDPKSSGARQFEGWPVQVPWNIL